MAMVPVTHQVNTNRGNLIRENIKFYPLDVFNNVTYQGTNAVMTPNTHMVTEAPHIAVLRPNLSETKPEQNEPRANPAKYKK